MHYRFSNPTTTAIKNILTPEELKVLNAKVKNLRDLRNHPIVQGVSDERATNEAIFVDLKDGWMSRSECSANLYGTTVKGVISDLDSCYHTSWTK